MSKSTVDRRAHPRVQTRFQLHGSPEEGGVVARMEASNLSLGGLQCTSPADFPEMTRLAVRLLLPAINGGKKAKKETDSIDVEAVVVRREPCQADSSGEPRYVLSLFFTKIDDGVKRRLASFIGMQMGAASPSASVSH